MPKITINPDGFVLVDEVNYGKVCDTIANNSHLTSDIQIALDEWMEKKAAVAADRDRLAKLLADASDAFDKGDIAELQKMRAAALQTENEKKLAAALAKKAEAELEIAALAK